MKQNLENKLLRVALYIRVSTDRQVKEGESLEAQETALVKYAKEHNYIIVDKYIDGGESGQKLNRTNLTRLLEDVKQDKIDLIIMTKLDRWFRSVSDFYKVQEILTKHKVAWKTIWEDYDTTTASGEFWLNVSLSLGRMEAKRDGERINAVFNHKYNVQKTVCTGNVPYGYKISEDKKIIIDDEKAQHIIDLYDYYIKTNCLSETVRWFQNNCNRKSYASIKGYLKNTAYIGLFKRHRDKEIIEQFSPRIISDDVFYKVQKLFKNNVKVRKHSNTSPYIFTGLLQCSECKHNLSGLYGWRNDTHYYRCKVAYEGINCTNKHNISEKKIEKYLLENISKSINDELIKINNVESKIKKGKDNTKYIQEKLKKLVELYTNSLIDMSYYKEQYELLNKQLLKEREKAQTPQVNIDNLKSIEKMLNSDFFTLYSTLDNLTKRKLWSNIIEYIEIDGLEIKHIEPLL